MSIYGWIITDDHISNEDKGVSGPSGLKPEFETQLKAGKGEQFKMFDDDGELYYSGLIVGDYDGFEPMDDFGMPNAGVTTIKYKGKSGEWEVL